MFVGLVGAFVSGVLIDVTKNFEGVAKVMCAFALICFIWFLEVNGCNMYGMYSIVCTLC